MKWEEHGNAQEFDLLMLKNEIYGTRNPYKNVFLHLGPQFTNFMYSMYRKIDDLPMFTEIFLQLGR